ncbi:uncharacterized protein TNCV_1458911 [Trichonephila clavipes]|nr:uncharacterized protein TNCV_1458911 [Trichonephila clavipes]
MNHSTPYFALMEDVIFGEMLYRHGKGALVFLEGKQAAMGSLDILADHLAMLHFYPDGEGYFMEDNATMYRARSVQDWFAEHHSDLQHFP